MTDQKIAWVILVRFPNPLLEVGWDYTAPIGGEFFFPPSQRGQFGQHMAKGVLIGLVHITRSHMLKLNFFFQSLILPFTLHFHPPAECNFCWRQLFQSDFSFSSFQISSCRMQLMFLLKVNASVFVKLFISYFFLRG